MNKGIQDLDGEIWKDVLGYEDLYQVSNKGRVKSLSKKVWNGKGYYKTYNIILSQSNDNFGYKRVILTKSINNDKRLKMVHRLVAEVFLVKQHNYNEVNHKDKNVSNNCVKNLEWVSSRENSTYRDVNNKNSSIYTGVSWDKQKQKWRATIYVNGKQKFLGRFDNEIDASKAYQDKLIELNETNKYMIYAEKTDNVTV